MFSTKYNTGACGWAFSRGGASRLSGEETQRKTSELETVENIVKTEEHQSHQRSI